jgi:hypothetical protein
MGWTIRASDGRVIQLMDRRFGARGAFLSFNWNFGQAPRLRSARRRSRSRRPGSRDAVNLRPATCDLEAAFRSQVAGRRSQVAGRRSQVVSGGRRDLVRAQARRVVEDLRRHHELVGPWRVAKSARPRRTASGPPTTVAERTCCSRKRSAAGATPRSPAPAAGAVRGGRDAGSRTPAAATSRAASPRRRCRRR